MKIARLFYLSLYPKPLTPDDVQSLLKSLKQDDKAAKNVLVSLIEHRLNHRYVRPLLHVPEDYKSGFLMMAASCLLIEALQSFYEGLEDTDQASKKAFKDFFEREKQFFPEFDEFFPKSFTREKTNNFYINIRCGILHQAETTGGYRIFRKGPLFNKPAKAINANRFLKAVNDCLNKYIEELRTSDCNSVRWNKAADKINYICKNCKS
jgi:hypothetical protein